MTFAPSSAYINPPHERSRSSGCFVAGGIMLLVGGIFGFAALWNRTAAKPPGSSVLNSTSTPGPTLTPIVVNADLAHLQETGAALDNDLKVLAVQSTQIVVAAQQGQLTQQAVIFATQLAFDGLHRAMTSTVAAEHDAQSTRQAQATQAAMTAQAEWATHATETERPRLEARIVASEVALVARMETDQENRSRAWVDWWLWRLAVVAVLGIATVTAVGFAIMLARKYSLPLDADMANYEQDEPDEEPDEIPLTKVMVPAKDGRSGRYVEIRVYPEKLFEFAVEVTRKGQSVAEGYWTGSEGILSLSQYDKMRDGLIAAGLGRWIKPEYPTLGWSLTADGWAALKLIATPTLALSPSETYAHV